MKKIYTLALATLLAGSATVTAAAAAVTSAQFVTDAKFERTFGPQRQLLPLLSKGESLSAQKAPARVADEAEHPASLNGKTYVAVYNDLSADLNEGFKVVENADGSVTLVGFAEGYDVTGTYDAATGRISIPTGVVIGQSSTYGDVTSHATDGSTYNNDPVTGTVNGNVIKFDNGLYGTVVYQGQPGGLVVMTKITATEANATMTMQQTNSSTGVVNTFTTPLLVTKTGSASLSVVGISNVLYGRYYQVPFSFNEAANTCTLTFGEAVDVYATSTASRTYYLGGLNAVGMIDDLELKVVTSDINTLMTADKAVLVYPNGTQYSGYTFDNFKIEVDFNIYTGAADDGGDDDTDTPTVNGISYLLDRASKTATVTGCLPTLTDINIPATVTSAGVTYDVVAVGENAFNGNATATSLRIPASIRTLATDAFRNLRAIKTVYIADLAAWCGVDIANGNANPIYNLFSSVTESRWGKLYINGELAPTAVVVPEGVTSMKRTFYGYKPLKAITLPSTLTEIGDQTFANCTKLTSIVVPEGVTNIGSAFWSCSALETATLPSTLKALNGSTFYGCKALKSVNLPEGLVSIGNMSFCSCAALGKLSLPSTLTGIGVMAFDGCSGLTEITSAAAVPPVAQTMAFEDVEKSIAVYVPAGTVDAYKAADQWSAFTNYLELAGVDDITADDSNAPVEYYNLSGVRVSNPANGLYIRRQGSKVQKVML